MVYTRRVAESLLKSPLKQGEYTRNNNKKE